MSAQSLAALDLANEVRQRHAVIKRQIADGGVTVAEILFTRRRELAGWNRLTEQEDTDAD